MPGRAVADVKPKREVPLYTEERRAVGEVGVGVREQRKMLPVTFNFFTPCLYPVRMGCQLPFPLRSVSGGGSRSPVQVHDLKKQIHCHLWLLSRGRNKKNQIKTRFVDARLLSISTLSPSQCEKPSSSSY